MSMVEQSYRKRSHYNTMAHPANTQRSRTKEYENITNELLFIIVLICAHGAKDRRLCEK